ncbi:hypothetical protein MPTK1_6g00830 [Marchantia polymorpha subsp. ruderalis]|uniref:Uncharacterized protein n=2 Tax=Marchantia polymorpha TaxID=3197 RepID=A0AAF6BM70_MARPO|nr:hypothetical protein MARPO_0052s0117 [Marchantia polymorpha]BBN13104.1 hypothetical protein Mp_6g00830 [Marchantia polymorpha subsp. ruderalis]|eukprot:PTQ38343.1 hypothetical protein MARPO_0052s0117 [Marchantia polymorpha]
MTTATYISERRIQDPTITLIWAGGSNPCSSWYLGSCIKRFDQEYMVHQYDNFGRCCHLEVNYKTLKAVVLYEPQHIQFPHKIDLDLLD